MIIFQHKVANLLLEKTFYFNLKTTNKIMKEKKRKEKHFNLNNFLFINL